jgi:hypothetical protein
MIGPVYIAGLFCDLGFGKNKIKKSPLTLASGLQKYLICNQQIEGRKSS